MVALFGGLDLVVFPGLLLDLAEWGEAVVVGNEEWWDLNFLVNLFCMRMVKIVYRILLFLLWIYCSMLMDCRSDQFLSASLLSSIEYLVGWSR